MKNPPPIETIIFDLGNVLIGVDYTRAAQKILALSDRNYHDIYHLFFTSDITSLFEQGRVSPREYFLKIKEALRLRIGYDEFPLIWNDIFFLNEQNRQMLALARQLRKRYSLAVLSNVNKLHFEYIKKQFSIFDAFHTVITSYELGLVKPDQRMYRRALEILSARPESTFYTDDRAALVASANQLGIRGFVYQGVERLKQDLSSCGVSTNEMPCL
jgi:putative hydrolase of the HAD superfamily